MSDKLITKKDVEYVAKLARLSIPEEEQKTYEGQLENILEYINKLKEKNTDGVEPTSHPHGGSNVWREDEAVVFKDRGALFKNAPDMEETYYKVKKVIE